MSLVEFALRQRRLGDACYWILMAIGFVAWRSLPVEVYPETRTSSAVAVTVWPGATAEQVERLVTRKIEEQIEGVGRVAWHRSESTANLSRVVVRFDDRATKSEVDAAFAALQSRINQIADLPEGCQRPSVSRFKLDEDTPFLRLCVTDQRSGGPLRVRHAAQKLKEELSNVPGVASVRLLGQGEREVRVLLDRAKLEEAGLSAIEVAAILRRSDVSLPVGSIATATQEVPVRFVGELNDLDQLGKIIVRKDPAGAHVLLKDVARFEEGLAQDFIRARYQGQRCVVVEITKASGANVMTVRDRVLEVVARYQKQTPEDGIAVDAAVDITPWVSSALGNLKQNLFAGCVLVFFVLCVFLGVRNSLLAMMGVPFAFLCTAIGMWALGITANTSSVFGLVLVSGMLVDEEIVVLDNTYRLMQAGLSRHSAIVQGMGQVLWPIFSSGVTTILAFLPLLFLRGDVGSLFYAVPVLVALTIGFSIFEWLFIVPGHVYHFGPRPRAQASGGPPRIGPITRLGRALAGVYLGMMPSLLRLRYLTVLLVAAMVAIAVAALRFIPVETLPAEFPMALINFETDNDASLDATDRLGAKLGTALDELSGSEGVVKNYLCVAGMQLTEHTELVRQSNLGMIWVQFHPTSTARRDPAAMLDLLRQRIAAYSRRHPEAALRSFTVQSMGTGLEQSDAIAVRVEHRDMAVCRQVAQRIRQLLAGIPGVTEIRDNMRQGPLELSLRAEEPLASEFGLTLLDIAATVRAAAEGLPAGHLRDATLDEVVPIRVRFDNPDRDSLDDLMAIPFKTPTGAEPRLEEVATFAYDQQYASLYHHFGRRLITVGATLEGRPVDAQGRPIDLQYVNRLISQEFPRLQAEFPGLALSLGGGYAQQRESFERLAVVAVATVALIYLTLLMEFRSYLQPFLVLFSLVFAFSGVVLGMSVHGYSLSMVTGVALVGLFGVAVNNAILLIEFINQAPREGADRFAPILEGCRVRLRPVMATTATTVVGLMPTALGLGGFSSVWSPFAACFSYGLAAATLLTLVLVPCFYMIVDDINRLAAGLIRRFWPWSASSDAAPDAQED